jgi:hypothetical protein
MGSFSPSMQMLWRTSIRSQLFPAKSFLIHHSSVILLFNTKSVIKKHCTTTTRKEEREWYTYAIIWWQQKNERKRMWHLAFVWKYSLVWRISHCLIADDLIMVIWTLLPTCNVITKTLSSSQNSVLSIQRSQLISRKRHNLILQYYVMVI